MSEQHPAEPPAVAAPAAPTSPPALPPARTIPPEPPPSSFGTSFGWALVALATSLLALASWDLYPDGASGMWAGYRDLVLILVLGYALCLLRCDLPRTPLIGACGIVGVLLVLEGVFLASTLTISIPEVGAGIVILLGAGLMASAPDR